MIISDLNVLEVVEAAEVVGGFNRTNRQTEFVDYSSISLNTFGIIVSNQPIATGNGAAADAKAEAFNPLEGTIFAGTLPTKSFANANTLSYTTIAGGSIAASKSVAVISPF